MEQKRFTITENSPIARDVFLMRLTGEMETGTRPGQFVNLALDGFYLRRPISLCDWTETGMTLIYKTVGRGTAYMATRKPGDTLDILTGLGNGFDGALSGERPLLVGGGVGVPPLYGLAKRLRERDVHPTVVLGFNTSADVFFTDAFAALGCDVVVATMDGSQGVKGTVVDAMGTLAQPYTYVYTCGPERMLRAVYDAADTDGQFSFEERMGCGFGACMGCSCETKYGSKRICRDGPVLTREEIIW